MELYTNQQLEQLTLNWGEARQITINGKIPTQALKLVEEFNKEYYEGEVEGDIGKIQDAIGDATVVCTMINGLLGERFVLPITKVAEDKINMIDDKEVRIKYILSAINIHIGTLCANAVRDRNNLIAASTSVLYMLFGLLAKEYKTDLNICWNIAYDEIKDRTGFLNEQGNFIKDEDLKRY